MNPLKKNANLFLSSSGNNLPDIYNSLIGFELAIKNKLLENGTWDRRIKHNIIPIIEQEIDKTKAIQLKNSLSLLKCVAVDGTIGTVSPEKYPDLRYFIFQEDDPGGSTDSDLEALYEIIKDIKEISKSKGKYL